MRASRSIAAIVAAVSGLLADLVAFGGDAIVATLLFAVTDADLLVLLFNRLRQLAEGVSWLPEGQISNLYYLALGLFVAVILVRIVRAWSAKRRDV